MNNTPLSNTRVRRASALIVTLVCLALLAMMMTAVVRQALAQKRYLDQRERRTQAHWLAEAGIERAAARLLADPGQYREKRFEIIPQSEVRIRVRPGKDSFVVTSEAKYPKDEAQGVSLAVSRSFRVTRQGAKARLELAD